MPGRHSFPRLLVAAAIAAFACAAAARADTPYPDFRKVAKWAISYDDLKLGMVEGIALCKWGDARENNGSPSCHVKLRNPATGALSDTVVPARLVDAGTAFGGIPLLSLTLDMDHAPLSAAVSPPEMPSQTIAGSDGESATVALDNGGVERRWQVPVARGGHGDKQFRFDLAPDANGSLVGWWSYLANPMTERGADGVGPVGAFHALSDDEIKTQAPGTNPGGFLGLQTGDAVWRPRLPRVYAIYTVEDETEVRYGEMRYPRGASPGIPAERSDTSTGARPESVFRTLVLVGSDLPVDGDKALLKIESKEDGLSYEIVAVGDGSSKTPTDRSKSQIERAFRDLTRDMDANEVVEFRKLDAAVVHVMLEPKPDPGPKHFAWGTFRGRWELQYGDNVADIRFARVFNEQESEVTSQLALPEQVVIEVETGAELADDTIKVRLGIAGTEGPGTAMTASRVAGRPRLYRTAPLIFAEAGAPTPPTGGAQVIAVAKGNRVYATVDRAETHFLRAGLASAVASEPSNLWLVELQNAWTCAPDWERYQWVSPLEMGSDWRKFAMAPAQDVTIRGASINSRFAKDTIPIRFGDHAAMLLLRDAFVQTINSQISELANVESDDGLVDAWYRTLQGVINIAPNSPLAQFKVGSPSAAGEVPFREAYSVDFEERTFQVYDTVSGQQRYREWRRQATRQLLVFLREQMKASREKAAAIPDCDRLELLKLTGHHFKGVAARVAPLLMKYHGLVIQGHAYENELAEPDREARSYALGLDDIAEAVENAENFTTLADTAIVNVALILIPPAAEIGWVAAGFRGGEAVGALAGAVGGLAMFGYQSATEIYQTYEQHEDIRFAFSTASVLGLDRDFDPEKLTTPWWHTGLSIFGQGVLTGVGLRGAIKPVREGIKVWRGAAIISETEKITLPVLRTLPVESQQDVAAVLLRAKEALADTAITDARAMQATVDFDRFAEEAKAAAAAAATVDPDPVAQELEAQAVKPIDDMKTVDHPPPDPLRVEKAKLATEDLADTARMEGPRVAAKPGWQIVPPELLDPGVEGPVEIPDSHPMPNSLWTKTVSVDGKPTEVVFQVGKLISWTSEYFNVYELERIPPELASEIEEKLGDKLVLKILKRAKLEAQASNEFNVGMADHVVGRMLKAQGRLDEAGIPYLPIHGWDDADILVQKFISREDRRYLFLKHGAPETYTRFANGPGLRKALAKLWGQLAESKLVWLDGHLNNVYFEFNGSEWVAGVLDSDMIGTFGEMQEGFYARQLRLHEDYMRLVMRNTSLKAPGDVGFLNARAIMEKLAEERLLVQYDWAVRRLMPRYITPQELEEAMPGLRYLNSPAEASAPAGLQPPAPTPRAPVPNLSPGQAPGGTAPQPPPAPNNGWLLPDAPPRRQFCNDNRTPWLRRAA